MNGQQLRAAIFDVGGVLFDDSIAPKMAELARKYSLDTAELDRARRAHRPKADLGEISEGEFWELVLADSGVRPSEDDCDVSAYLRPRPESLGLVRECRRGGLKTAILSNDSRELARLRQEACGARELFDVIVVSADHGIAKPDRRIFDLVLNALAFAPEVCLFIDDTPRNIEAARRYGLQAHLFTTVDSLRLVIP